MDTTDNTAVIPAAETLRELGLFEIDVSPTNPRKRFDEVKLAELAESIRGKGLIQPVTVRPRGKRFELVVGERRFRASALAGRVTILARVRELTDREVCEVQLEENGQRDDVHPLEEADAYEHLRAQGASLEELAARTGKSESYVRHRLQYCAPGAEARAAFLDGKLTPATAFLVARVPTAPLQVEAVKEVTTPDYSGEIPTPRRAGEIIRGRFMLALAGAPFDRGDAALVPAAGPCTTCPKRTGAQPELFADVKSQDTCTDPGCFADKKAAHWAEVSAKARAKGQAVLSEKETKKVFPYNSDHLAHGCGYVDIAEKTWEFDNKSPKAVLGKGNLPPITVALDPSGTTRELVKVEDLKKALKAAGVTKTPPMGSSSSDEQKKIRERMALQRATLERALGQIVSAVEGDKATLAVWRFVAGCIVERGWADECAVVAKRRGLEAGRSAGSAALAEMVGEMTETELRGLVVEVLCARPPNAYTTGHAPRLQEACHLYGVDLKAIEREVTAEKKASAKKPSAKPAAKSSSKPAAKVAKKKASARPAKKGGAK
jgi:ParB/RepB/Spo0J family partition protein